MVTHLPTYPDSASALDWNEDLGAFFHKDREHGVHEPGVQLRASRSSSVCSNVAGQRGQSCNEVRF